jgi:hypothetical protein
LEYRKFDSFGQGLRSKTRHGFVADDKTTTQEREPIMSKKSVKLVRHAEKSSIVTPADGTVAAVLNTVTKEDVIAILVQERSDELSAEKASGESELHRLDAALQSVGARWPKVMASHKKDVSTAYDEKAAGALHNAGYVKLVVEMDEGCRDDAKNCFTFQVSLKASEKSHSYMHSYMSRNVTVPYDAKAYEILTETARLKREITTAQEHLLKIRREITGLPVMERRARARIALVSLGRDRDGAALLAKLREVKELSTAL